MTLAIGIVIGAAIVIAIGLLVIRFADKLPQHRRRPF
jgi:hypothetical protein